MEFFNYQTESIERYLNSICRAHLSSQFYESQVVSRCKAIPLFFTDVSLTIKGIGYTLSNVIGGSLKIPVLIVSKIFSKVTWIQYLNQKLPGVKKIYLVMKKTVSVACSLICIPFVGWMPKFNIHLHCWLGLCKENVIEETKKKIHSEEKGKEKI